MSTQEQSQTSTQRHWLYGFNVVLLVLIAVVILIFTLFLTNKYTYREDLTSAGIFSLSDSTKKLLASIEAKNQKYEIISVFGATERGLQVRDLLNEYQRASKAITVEDFSTEARETLESRIRERYTAELKPYEKAVADFSPLAREIEQFAQIEAANFGAVALEAGASETTRKTASEFQILFSSKIPEQLKRTQKRLDDLTNHTSPNWTDATDELKKVIEGISSFFTLFADPKQVAEAIPPLKSYAQKNASRYADLNKKVLAFEESLNALKPLKVQEVIESVTPGSVIIIGPDSAKVVTRSDIIKFQPSPNPRANPEDSESFEGEQAISSALLSMSEPEKKKIVFVTAMPAQLIEGQFSSIAQRFREANFDVLEWSPPAPGMPQQDPTASPTPPAQGVGVVWIVFPPEQTNPQMAMMGMPPPAPTAVIEALNSHIAAGGNVLIFAEAAAPSPFGDPPAEFPYESITRPFGIDVQPKYSVVNNVPTPEGSAVVPQFALTRFPDHPITKPLQGLPTIIVALPNQQRGIVGLPTVVRVSDSKPANVTASVILDTTGNKDAWGETAYTSQDVKFDKDADLLGPVPLAVAASRPVTINGKTTTQHVIVIGSKLTGINRIVDDAQTFLTSSGIVSVKNYPGNSELLLNSALWLSGYENMIAVSSKASVALRIKDISPAGLTFIRWGILYAGAPAAALIAGVIIWFIRRR